MFDSDRENGHPHDRNLEWLKTPQRVWLDLSAIFPVDRESGLVNADGLDLQATVPGLLRMWKRSKTGHRVGWVLFSISEGEDGRGVRVGQWVLETHMRPRDEPAPWDARDAPWRPVFYSL